MEKVRQKHALPNKVIAVMLTIAMVFSVLTGIVPGTSITADAAGDYLSDYSVGEALNNKDGLGWDHRYPNFTVTLLAGGYGDTAGEVRTEVFSRETEYISVDGGVLWIDSYTFTAYDANKKGGSDKWYVVSIDYSNRTITLTGTAAAKTVTLRGGDNATVSGGATTQNVNSGENMSTVTYTANTGYAFPADDGTNYPSDNNGVTVARTSDTVVTVSGTPTANVEVTVPDAQELPKTNATVKFHVVNGKWDNDEHTDIELNLEGHQGIPIKLTTDQIPTAGTRPDPNYRTEGTWDVTPDTTTEITPDSNKTYTFTYTQKERISVDVTFKVAGGTWNDGTTADKKVTLSGFEGDELKLTAGQIPVVGTKPDAMHNAGDATYWDDQAGMSYPITENTTFTYTYPEKQKAVYTVAPASLEPVYDKTEKALITNGATKQGTIKYALGTDATTAPTDGWGDVVPKATNAGAYYVWSKIVADDTHLDSDPIAIPVLFQGKSVIVQGIKAKEKIYDGTTDAEFDCSEATFTGLLEGDSLTVSAEGKFADENAGEDKIANITKLTLGGESASNYVLATSGSQTTATATILRMPTEIKWSEKTNFVYDGTPKVIDAEITNLIDGDKVGITVEGEGTDVGIYTATAAGLTGDAAENYSLAGNVYHIFIITKADATINVSIEGWTYGDKPNAPEITVVPEGKQPIVEYKSNNDGKSAYGTTVPTAAGTYNIRVSVQGDKNYNDTSVEDTFVIAPKDVTLTWGKTDLVYDGNDQCPTVTVEGLVGEDEISATVVGAATAVGTHTARVTELTGTAAANYKLPAETTKDYTISKSEIPDGIAVTMDNWVYGDAPNAPEVEGNKEGANVTYQYKVKDADDATYTTKVPVDAGEYTVQATVAATAGYVETKDTDNFEILPRSAVISWPEEAEFVCDGTQQAPEAEVTNLVNGDKVELSYAYKVDDDEHTEYDDTMPSAAGKYIAKVVGISDSNYTVNTDAEKAFEIVKATNKPEVYIGNWVYGGEARKPFVYFNDSDGDVSFSYRPANGEEEPWSSTVPTNAGTYEVKATIEGDDIYDDAEATNDFTIEKAPLYISVLDAYTDFKEDAPEFELYYDEFVNGDDASVIEGDIQIACDYKKGDLPGEYPITVSGDDVTAANYEITFVNDEDGGILTVEEVEAEITTDPAIKYGLYKGELQPIAEAGVAENGTIYYRVDGGAWSEDVPEEIFVGEYTVEWYLEPDEGYFSTSSEDKPAGKYKTNIFKRPVMLTWELGVGVWPNEDDIPLTTVYTGEDQCPVVIADGICAGDAEFIEVTVTGAATAVGKHTATARLTAKNAGEFFDVTDNYMIASKKSVEFEILQKDPSEGENPATLTMAGWTYGDDASDPVITNNVGGGTVTFSYKPSNGTDEDYTTAKPSKAGTYTVKAEIAATENYKAATLTQDFTIEQKTADLEWGERSFKFDTEAHIPTCEVTNLINGDKVTVDLIAKDTEEDDDTTGTPGKSAVGEYVVKAIGLTGKGAENYKLPEIATQTFKVTRGDVELTVNITGWTYGDEPNKPEVEGNPGETKVSFYYGIITETAEDIVATTPENSGATEKGGVPKWAGNYIVAAFVDRTDDYNMGFGFAEFSIEKKTVSLEWTGTSLTYTGEEQKPVAKPANIVGEDECTVVVTGAQTDPGEYIATAASLDGADCGNYKLPETVTQTFIISKETVNLSVSIEDWEYGAEAAEPEVTITPEAAVDPEDEPVVEYKAIDAKDSEYSEDVPTEAGMYTVRVTYAGTTGYAAAEATDTFKITPKEVGLIWTKLTTIYNAEDQCPEVTITGLVEGDEEKVTAKVTGAATAVGTHTATVTSLKGEAAANYVLPDDPTAEFEILKADLADPQIVLEDWTYGEKPNVPTVTGNTEGANVTFMYKGANEEDTEYTTKVPSLAGTYNIKAIIAETAGYNGVTLTKDFMINKAPLDLELTLEGWTYGDEPNEPELEGNMEDGEETYTYYVDSECEEVTTPENSGAEEEGGVPVFAGTYVLKVNVETTANYLDGETTVEFVIDQKELKVVADDVSKVYGEEDPELTYEVEGLVEGDEIAGELEREEGDDAGEYEITRGTIDAGDNYVIDFTPGLFTINKADTTITVEPEAVELTYDGDTHTLVTASEVVGGKMLYALGEDAETAPEADAFVEKVPEAANAEVYYVWYMVQGDNNHKDTDPACIISEIKEVDKNELDAAIDEAEEFLESIEDNEDYADIADELESAIDEAKEVAENKNVTEDEVAAATEDMAEALEEAEAEKLDVDKANFEEAKNAAKADAEAKAKAGDSAASKKLIEDAKAAIDAMQYDETKTPEDNQAAIDNKLNELQTALDNQRAADKAAADEAARKAKEAADTQAANAVTNKINNLPAANKITKGDKAAVEDARNAYNALTADQKAKVSADTLKKLTDAEAAVKNASKYSNEWANGQWYDANGSASYAPKGQWKQNGTGWWYEDASGWYPANQWQKIDGKWYYFTANGYMDYSEYRDGYWLGADGAWVTSYSGGHWMQDGTGWWYTDNSGWYPVNQWLWIDGSCYYFGGDGYMLTNQSIDGYWVGENGAWVQ
ncbi:MAG: hypothetical protein J5929_01355 [Eubacterium sp.]|nr:hypothetical protein [Eubacterium sp.]